MKFLDAQKSYVVLLKDFMDSSQLIQFIQKFTVFLWEIIVFFYLKEQKISIKILEYFQKLTEGALNRIMDK